MAALVQFAPCWASAYAIQVLTHGYAHLHSRQASVSDKTPPSALLHIQQHYLYTVLVWAHGAPS